MNGNTHFDVAALERPQLVTEETANEHYVGEQGITDETMQFAALNRVAEATLALAFEQRTGNLISLLAMGRVDMTGWAENQRDDWLKQAEEVSERLGLVP